MHKSQNQNKPDFILWFEKHKCVGDFNKYARKFLKVLSVVQFAALTHFLRHAMSHYYVSYTSINQIGEYSAGIITLPQDKPLPTLQSFQTVAG